MAPQRKAKKPSTLSCGRPPTLARKHSSAAPSARKSRSLIRSFHHLSKAHTAALNSNDAALAETISSQLDALGGLEQYQAASIAGQHPQRGGDSSKTLTDWLIARNLKQQIPRRRGKLRMLEVGALSAENECSRLGLFDVTRIDLNAQASGITKQDFMQRSLPTSDDERFDCVSLSLVLNYVPAPAARGDMLKRVSYFLRNPNPFDATGDEVAFPSLFLVLPAACVVNSRYLDESRLEEIMFALGYKILERKMSAKLIYQMWRYRGGSHHDKVFAKREIRPGTKRNNFAIVLE